MAEPGGVETRLPSQLTLRNNPKDDPLDPNEGRSGTSGLDRVARLNRSFREVVELAHTKPATERRDIDSVEADKSRLQEAVEEEPEARSQPIPQPGRVPMVVDLDNPNSLVSRESDQSKARLNSTTADDITNDEPVSMDSLVPEANVTSPSRQNDLRPLEDDESAIDGEPASVASDLLGDQETEGRVETREERRMKSLMEVLKPGPDVEEHTPEQLLEALKTWPVLQRPLESGKVVITTPPQAVAYILLMLQAGSLPINNGEFWLSLNSDTRFEMFQALAAGGKPELKDQASNSYEAEMEKRRKGNNSLVVPLTTFDPDVLPPVEPVPSSNVDSAPLNSPDSRSLSEAVPAADRGEEISAAINRMSEMVEEIKKGEVNGTDLFACASVLDTAIGRNVVDLKSRIVQAIQSNPEIRINLASYIASTAFREFHGVADGPRITPIAERLARVSDFLDLGETYPELESRLVEIGNMRSGGRNEGRMSASVLFSDNSLGELKDQMILGIHNREHLGEVRLEDKFKTGVRHEAESRESGQARAKKIVDLAGELKVDSALFLATLGSLHDPELIKRMGAALEQKVFYTKPFSEDEMKWMLEYRSDLRVMRILPGFGKFSRSLRFSRVVPLVPSVPVRSEAAPSEADKTVDEIGAKRIIEANEAERAKNSLRINEAREELVNRVKDLNPRSFTIENAENIVYLAVVISELGGLGDQQKVELKDQVQKALSSGSMLPSTAFSEVYFGQIENIGARNNLEDLNILFESAKMLGLYENNNIPGLKQEIDRIEGALGRQKPNNI